MVEIFKFMRKYRYRTAKWDTELTCYNVQFFKFNGAWEANTNTVLNEELRREWAKLNERLLETLGDCSNKPKWFHV